MQPRSHQEISAPHPCTVYFGHSPLSSSAGGLISSSSGSGCPLAPRISLPKRHGSRGVPGEIQMVPAKQARLILAHSTTLVTGMDFYPLVKVMAFVVKLRRKFQQTP